MEDRSLYLLFFPSSFIANTFICFYHSYGLQVTINFPLRPLPPTHSFVFVTYGGQVTIYFSLHPLSPTYSFAFITLFFSSLLFIANTFICFCHISGEHITSSILSFPFFPHRHRGSAIAKIVGNNVTKFDQFDNEVRMFVYEEIIDGKKLTEIINTTHENVKYLPGKKLPPNVVRV